MCVWPWQKEKKLWNRTYPSVVVVGSTWCRYNNHRDWSRCDIWHQYPLVAPFDIAYKWVHILVLLYSDTHTCPRSRWSWYCLLVISLSPVCNIQHLYKNTHCIVNIRLFGYQSIRGTFYMKYHTSLSLCWIFNSVLMHI